MQNPKISIIMPVYNVEKYLPKCLDSLVNQTLKDIEIICINDGSTDNSLEILQEYAKKDNRIQIISKQNEGQGVARNIGIEHAQGEYLGFVDPDDWVELEMYEQMYNQAKNLNSEIVICDYLRIIENTNKAWVPTFFEISISPTKAKRIDFPTGENVDKNLLNKTLLVSPCYSWNRIYRKTLLEQYNVKFSNLRSFEDIIFILKSHINAQNISVIKKPYYNYLVRNTSTLRKLPKIYIQSIKTIKEIDNFLTLENLQNSFEQQFNYFLILHTICICNRFSKLEKFLYLKKIKKYLTKEDYHFLKKKLALKYLENQISITNIGKYKIINIFGIKIKHNRFKTKFPIDLVYLWVDGNDIEWQKEKQKWQEKLGLNQDNKILNDCRFVDNEELKYSLRSVAKNLPWVNHIYIVTNGQVPKWLDTNHPKITIVNHKEIMPEDALPTFNSEAIETCIHNIPDLSEHFLFANDDTFVHKKISPYYFFDKKENPIIRFVNQNWKQKQIENKLYFKNITYSINLIFKKYNKKYSYQSAHNIDCYRKSDYKECAEIFRNEFKKTCYSKFRTNNSVQRIIVSLYTNAVKKYKIKVVRNKSKKTPLENIYLSLEHPIKIDRILNRHRKVLKLFCINDDENTKQEDRELLKSYLEFLFPEKQCWEL